MVVPREYSCAIITTLSHSSAMLLLSPPMKLFRSASVYALAMRVHGGPLGHAAHLKKLADKGAKAKATREKNGTVPAKKAPRSPRYSLASSFPAMIALIIDNYDDEPIYDDY